MVKLVNRAYVSTATTGTGTITLGAAEPGQQTFASAGILNGDTVRYTIEDGTAWEIGTGTYSSTGPTLTRTVTESSAAGAEINLSGAARVYVTVAAGDLQKAADMDQGVATTDSPSFAGLTVDTNTLYVDAVDNRVGIGTTSPAQPLDVNGVIKTASGLVFGTGQSYLYSSTSSQIGFRIGSDGPYVVLNDDDGSGASLLNASGYLAFGTLTSENVRITTGGKVLIGRTVDTLGGGGGSSLQVGSGAGSSGMTVHSATTGIGDIQFADGVTGADSYRGLVRYDHNGNYMSLWTNASERFRITSGGNVGIGTSSPAATLDVAGTGSIKVPVGTTAQRPTATTGLLRFNSTDGSFEGYDGSAWGSIGGGGGATGGGSDELFFENGQTMTTDYTIPATKNAMSTGPITINSGVTLTVEAGARYVVI